MSRTILGKIGKSLLFGKIVLVWNKNVTIKSTI